MSSEARYRLLYEDYETKNYFRFSYTKFSVIALCFPFFSFIFCVVYSVIFNFDRVTSTHCNAYNFLPSISAAIGKFSPQYEVWKYSILVHAIPRFFMATSYLQYNREVLRRSVLVLVYLAALLNIIENIGLILLSVYSSSENYPVHEKAFITFIITSEIYMLMIVILHSKFREQAKNQSEVKSLRWKKRLFVINITCIAAATYFFIRHNNGCENYVYTLFAISEYIVVLTNMAFHMTANMDFRDRDMIFTRNGIYLSQRTRCKPAKLAACVTIDDFCLFWFCGLVLFISYYAILDDEDIHQITEWHLTMNRDLRYYAENFLDIFMY